MPIFRNCLTAIIALAFAAAPASATVNQCHKKCDPPLELIVYYDGYCNCVPKTTAYVSGPANDQTITLTPAPGSAATVRDIFKSLGRPADASVTTDMFGTKSLELKGVNEKNVPKILDKLGINQKDIQ